MPTRSCCCVTVPPNDDLGVGAREPAMSRVGRPALRTLATRLGVLPGYVDQGGRWRDTTNATCLALLTAMGVDASTEAAARNALAALAADQRDRLLAPTRVVDARASRRLALCAGLPPRDGGTRRAWRVEIELEDGGRRRARGFVARGAREGIVLRFRRPLPLGYHRLRLVIAGRGGAEIEALQSLIVTPGRCPRPRDVLGRARAVGILAQLYTLRSADDWGIGGLGELDRLVDWAGAIGADFVGLNPLHALANRGHEISPYSPVSRLYRNSIYLDVTAVPELGETPAIQGWLAGPDVARRLADLRQRPRVAYAEVAALKREAMTKLHAIFRARHVERGTMRGRAYAAYVAAEGATLDDHATFLALQADLAPRHGDDWRRWPARFRDPRSVAVRDFAARHSREIDFHRFLQFELDRQLEASQGRARGGGQALGLYQDLAIGSSSTGSDAWAFADVFLEGATLGAPPDTWYARGQDWGFHPLDPRRLAASGYAYWVRLIRGALRHAGALRIDHVIGLCRQFWVPADRTPADGGYVRFPADDLLGILALESARAGAVVIGEDLGTVPRGMSRTLARWGILSTRVLYFARSRRGAFSPARAYPPGALVSANTHDMAPLAGYWEGRDLKLRWRSGQLGSRAALARARRERGAERRALERRLRAERLLPTSPSADADAAFTGAVHAFLGRTPAALVGLSLDDIVGEREPVNLPGAGLDVYPSWSRRLALPVERLGSDDAVRVRLGGVLGGARARVTRRRSSSARRGRAARVPAAGGGGR